MKIFFFFINFLRVIAAFIFFKIDSFGILYTVVSNPILLKFVTCSINHGTSFCLDSVGYSLVTINTFFNLPIHSFKSNFAIAIPNRKHGAANLVAECIINRRLHVIKVIEIVLSLPLLLFNV